MTLNPAEVKKIKSKMPTNGRKLIHEKIQYKVGLRMIDYVLAGTEEDNHGIIAAALEVIEEEKIRRSEISKKLQKL